MTENGVLTRGKDRRHPPPPLRDPADSDDVSSPVHFVQPPLLKPPGDGPTSHPEFDKLRPTDHAVLPPSQPLHFPLKNFSGQLSTYTVPN